MVKSVFVLLVASLCYHDATAAESRSGIMTTAAESRSLPQALRAGSRVKAQSTVVGTTPVTFSVTAGGSSVITVPIQAPPGSAGAAPNLALTYTSSIVLGQQAGAGMSLSGMVAISRVAETTVQDGIQIAASLLSTDRFTLAGKSRTLGDTSISPAPITFQHMASPL
jgi:hypothetical protein